MARWRKALLASTVGVAAATTLVALPASAAPASLNIEYECVNLSANGIAKHGPVRLATNLTFATDLVVGDGLNLTWKLGYADASRFTSPGYFGAGATVSVLSNIQLTSSWTGILQPTGSLDQATKLRPDTPLTLPAAVSDFGRIDRAGVIQITPKDIVVDFTPPDGSVLVNDGNDADNPVDLEIDYHGGAWTPRNDLPASQNHFHHDLHETGASGAKAELEFIGTGVDYIGPRDKDAGPVNVYLDGVLRGTVDPSRDEDGKPVNEAHNGGFTHWKSPSLAYGKHKIMIENASSNLAWLDAYKVHTNTAKVPSDFHRAICRPVSTPVSITVTVRDKVNPTPSGSPTVSPSVTPTGTPTATGTPTSTGTATPTTTTPARHPDVRTTWDRLVSVVPPGSTTTPKATPGATATRYIKAQVLKTPKGGVETGQAPERREPYGLMAGGSMLLLGSVAGGLVLRRRRAAHATTRGELQGGAQS